MNILNNTKFEKVSYEQFEADYIKLCNGLDINISSEDIDDEDKKYLRNIYDNIKLPKRATAGSAGYDFYAPFDFHATEKPLLIPTGIRCKIDEGFVLKLYPRSGLGFKYRFALNNTTGIIDSDYYNAKNEGHIMAKVYCNPGKDNVLNYCPVKEGEAFMQGIFVPYYVTCDDEATGERVGGFGSTSKGE